MNISETNIQNLLQKTLEELGIREDTDDEKLSKIGKNVKDALVVYRETNERLDALLKGVEPSLAADVRFFSDCMAAAQSMIFAEIAPLLPEARKLALQLNIAAARPKKTIEEEALIDNALGQWGKSSLSVYKLSIATAAELASKGVVISGKALRDRYKALAH